MVNLTNFTANVNNMQALSDRPNEVDGLTSSELKARFDKAGSDIKEYLNGTLITELETILNEIDSAIAQIPTDYVSTSDSRLTNSRTCNNSFDNALTARSNLKINYGTELPATADDGSIFFLY